MKEIENKSDFPVSKFLTVKANQQGIPLHGTFELTSRCNFNCKMCYVHNQTNAEQLRKEELPVEDWLRIAREARKAGLLFLLLTGGEAMLRQDFVELYQKLAKMGFRIVINTNGSTLTEEIQECFRKWPPARVNVSLYGGCEETYENLCGVQAYEKVINTIHTLKNMGISVRVTMTLTPYNAKDMEKVYKFSKKENTLVSMTSYMFPQTRLHEKNEGCNEGRFGAEEAGRYMVRREKLTRTKEELLGQAKQILLQCENPRNQNDCCKKGEGIQCQAGRSAFWITWDGKMCPCGLMTSPQVDVRTERFEDAWGKIREKTAKIFLPSECTGCINKELCKVCAAMCQSETGSFDKRPDYVCRMTNAMKEEYRKELKQ